MKQNASLVYGITAAGVLVAAVVVSYFVAQKDIPRRLVATPTPQSEATPMTSPVVQASPDVSDLRAGGNSYRDSQGAYVFLYPKDYSIDGDDAHKRIFKRGEQQRPQSEISNGVIMVFEPVELQGKSLEAFVDAHIQSSTADGTSKIVQPKKAVTINGYPGFTYQMNSLGSSVSLVLQKNAQSKNAVIVTYMVADPQQKGYQSEVNNILSTLELLK